MGLEESIKCYMVITGACSFGTKGFVSSLEEKKDTYKVREIIKLTEGQFGNREFKNHFN